MLFNTKQFRIWPIWRIYSETNTVIHSLTYITNDAILFVFLSEGTMYRTNHQQLPDNLALITPHIRHTQTHQSVTITDGISAMHLQRHKRMVNVII